jgi:hypothetical protein
MASSPRKKWLSAALDYIPAWIELQLRGSGQPGCVVAIALKDRVLLDQAFGVADLSTGEKLPPPAIDSPSLRTRRASPPLVGGERPYMIASRRTEVRTMAAIPLRFTAPAHAFIKGPASRSAEFDPRVTA